MGVVIKDLEKLRKRIIVKGFSQQAFGKHIGISQPYTVQLIKGKRNPSPQTAKKIADALDIKFDDLFDIT